MMKNCLQNAMAEKNHSYLKEFSYSPTNPTNTSAVNTT